MPITRDPNFPAEIANLVDAFNRCADGHTTNVVLEAAANMLIAAVGGHSRANGKGRAYALALAADIGQALPEHR